MTARTQRKSRVPLMLGGGCVLAFLTCIGSCFIEWPPHETSAEVDLPAGAPYRHAKLIVRTRTFEGPLPISPIGGPDAAATVALALDHGPPRQLSEDYYKRDWVSFRDLDSGNFTLTPAVDGLSWCAGSCERSMHLWFHEGRVISCTTETRARPSMRALAAGLLAGQRDCSGEVGELALEWVLTQDDVELDVLLARWLVEAQGSWASELRDRAVERLRPRLRDNPAAARVVLDHWARLVARASHDKEYERFDTLTEGFEGRARPSWFMARPRFSPDAPVAGRLDVWTTDFLQPRLVARFPLDGGLVAFDLDAGVPLQLLILADGAEPVLRGLDARGALLGDVTLRPLTRTVEVEVTRAGEPLAGADVALSYKDLVKLAGPVVTARTNAAGIARLPPVASSDVIVLVRAPNGACAMFEERLSVSNDRKVRRAVDFAKLRAYRGQVLGPDGLPRAGLKVRGQPFLPVPGADCVTRRATTDENGEFTFEAIPDVASVDVLLEAGGGRVELLGTRSPTDERPFRLP